MKKLLTALSCALMFGIAGAQQTPAKSAPAAPAAKTAKTAKPMSAPIAKPAPPAAVKMKKDGTPDRRYKANQHLKKDGTPDKRYKSQ